MRIGWWFILVGPIAAQVVPPAPTEPSLPTYVVGASGVWNRSVPQKYAVDITFAKLLSPRTYLWSSVSTPIHKEINGQAVPSTILTGVAYVPACTPTMSVCVVMFVQAGAAISPASAVSQPMAEPAFNGSVGVSFKVGGMRVMPFMRALATGTASTSTAAGTTTNGISTVLDLGVQFQYTFK